MKDKVNKAIKMNREVLVVHGLKNGESRTRAGKVDLLASTYFVIEDKARGMRTVNFDTVQEMRLL